MPTTSGRDGFTLIELLVVIAIIAILASILFPVFARAREKARESSCISNQKQIGAALMMYASDYDEELPLAAAYKADGTTLDQVIEPYVKNSQIWRCPSDKNKTWQTNGLSYDYGNNAYIAWSPTQYPNFSGNESTFVLLSDFSSDWHTKGSVCLYADGHVKVRARN